jgi:hypothetical protein
MKKTAWLVACLTMISACGGDDRSISEPSPLTNDQAARLAQAGYSNTLAGGAEFEANSAFLGVEPSETVRLVGVVDWENHVGRAMVSTTGSNIGLTEVYWDENTVLERWPGMDELVPSLGGPQQAWIARSPEPEVRQIDRLIALIVGLALEQPENAILLQQTEGSAFLRDDVLRGQEVEVLRYGTRNVYWLAADDGSMMRFEGNSASGSAPTVIDFLAFGRVDVERPDDRDVLPASAIPEIYSAFAGG